MERKGVRLSVFKPIAQLALAAMRLTRPLNLSFARTTSPAAEPLKMSHVESLLSSNQKDVLMEDDHRELHHARIYQRREVVLVEGLVPTR